LLPQIATVIAPLFVCAGIGFAWARSGRNFDADMLGRIVGTVALPCLTFSTLTKLSVSPAVFARMAGLYLVALAAFAAVGFVALRIARLDLRVYGPPMVFSNCGNMGLPVCLFAFGDAGLALAVCVFLANSILNYTLGVATFAGELSFRSVTRNVLVYSTLIALAFLVAGVAPPRWLAGTTSFLGALSIPYMIVALGVAVGRLTVSDLPRTIALSVLRQGVGFAVGWSLATLAGLDGAERGVLILQCAMPVAVVNYLFALRYNRRPEQVASMVVATTVISYAMLPLVLLVVLPGAP
jgi:malate permease and related proteins